MLDGAIENLTECLARGTEGPPRLLVSNWMLGGGVDPTKKFPFSEKREGGL